MVRGPLTFCLTCWSYEPASGLLPRCESKRAPQLPGGMPEIFAQVILGRPLSDPKIGCRETKSDEQTSPDHQLCREFVNESRRQSAVGIEWGRISVMTGNEVIFTHCPHERLFLCADPGRLWTAGPKTTAAWGVDR